MEKFEEQDFDEKRLARRNRRKKSQLIAYIILAVILVFVILGIGIGVHCIKKTIVNIKAEKAEIAAQEAASLEEQQNTVIETPDDESSKVQEMSDGDVLDEIVYDCVSQLTIEEKVAGLFMLTPEQLTGVATVVKAGSSTQEALSKYSIGGLVYSAKNIKSTDQISEMLKSTKNMCKYPVFTAIKEDGTGDSAITQSIGGIDSVEVNNSDSAYSLGSNIASTMMNYGFNFDLAPNLDISENGNYGTDVDTVKDITTSFANALNDGGVTACVGSFPVRADASDGMVSSDVDKETLTEGVYKLYEAAFETGNVKAVMLSNVSLPNVVGDNTPVSLSSKMIEDELRGELKFDGVVITGPLNQGAVTGYYTSAEAAVNALNAGADIIYLPENFEEAYNGILEALENGILTEERIDKSISRIYRIKYADKVGENN